MSRKKLPEIHFKKLSAATVKKEISASGGIKEELQDDPTSADADVENDADADVDDDDDVDVDDDDDNFEDEVDEDYFEEPESPMNEPVIQITVAGKAQKRSAGEDADVDVPVDDDDDVDDDPDEDDEAAEDLFTDDDLTESPSPRKRPKRKMSKSVAYNETERPKRKRPNRDGPPRKRIIVKKPVNCPECDKVLCDSSSLKLHMVSLTSCLLFFCVVGQGGY